MRSLLSCFGCLKQKSLTVHGVCYSPQHFTSYFSIVLLSNVIEIKLGQKTEKFLKNRNAELEHMSFSLIYYFENDSGVMERDTLDLIAKEVAEFHRWTKCLVALFNKSISPITIDQAKAEIRRQIGENLLESSNLLSLSMFKAKTKKKDLQALVLDHNQVYMVGWGEWGQMGLRHLKNIDTPVFVDSVHDSGVECVAMGWAHTLIYMTDGSLLVSGNRLGTGLPNDACKPEIIDSKSYSPVVSISCGDFHSAFLTEVGEVYTVGCGIYGQLGHESDRDEVVPMIVTHLSSQPIVSIACGGSFMVALSEFGEVFTWGSNLKGQLGLGDFRDRNAPQAVESLSGKQIQQIAAGNSHVIVSSETVPYSWGMGDRGQLGLGNTTTQCLPQPIESLRGAEIISISCGFAHSAVVVTMASSEIQSVYVWGSNTAGQLGITRGDTVDIPSVVRELGDVHAVQTACGAFHTIVLTESGEIWSTGKNSQGQLGLPFQVVSVREFTKVAGLEGKKVRRVICGAYNTAFLVARTWVKDQETVSSFSYPNAYFRVRSIVWDVRISSQC